MLNMWMEWLILTLEVQIFWMKKCEIDNVSKLIKLSAAIKQDNLNSTT